MTNSNRRVVKTNRTYDVVNASRIGPEFSGISNMSDRMTIRLDQRMRLIVERLATVERKSASQVIRDALYKYLEAIEARG
jgi:hypothetical protein